MTDNLYEQIAKIEREIARLPEGGIAKKTIKEQICSFGSVV